MERAGRTDVLVVDDEAQILTAVERILKRDLPVSVETTSDPRTACEILKERPPRVLLTDFRMPGMSGAELLRQARLHAPDTVRILITGQADREHIIEAINSGRIFRFVAKPWDNPVLRATVQEALEEHDSALRRGEAYAAARNVGDLQRAILPGTSFRLADGTAACSATACEHATGDHVDAFMLPCGRAALLLGDVCGHGIGAALFVFTARALLRSGLQDGLPLDDVVTRTNRFLCTDMSEGRFLTLFAATHDPDREVLTYLNAGHNPPLILGRDGLVPLTRTALPLGLLENAPYGPVEETPLRHDETIFAYTDGVTEARNADDELYGIGRLRALLEKRGDATPDEILATVQTAVAGFRGYVAADDDVTLLAYRPRRQAAAV